MFQQSRKQSARKLLSVMLSLALYILMFPTVSSRPRVTAQSPGNGIAPDAIPVIAPGRRTD